MSETSKPSASQAAPQRKPDEPPEVIKLVSYPKIVFLYPVLLASLAIAIYLSIVGSETHGHTVTALFLVVFALNLGILAFDFPRATSLTLFFCAVAVVLGAVILFMKRPDLLPTVSRWLTEYKPHANASFYWGFSGILGTILLVSLALLPFDYWEVRRNELLHHHGILANLERFPAPNLRVDKEINDIFEYLLLQSGRLIIQISSERRAIILDNVPRIRKKEAALTRMLGALHVTVGPEGEQ